MVAVVEMKSEWLSHKKWNFEQMENLLLTEITNINNNQQ